MASVKLAARTQATSVRPAVSPVPCVARQVRSTAVKAFVGDLPAARAEKPAQNPLDMVMSLVQSLFDDQAPQTSEELQLPPELKAYLDEMEAHSSGSHGGWVHSHIAERLASTSESFSD